MLLGKKIKKSKIQIGAFNILPTDCIKVLGIMLNRTLGTSDYIEYGNKLLISQIMAIMG